VQGSEWLLLQIALLHTWAGEDQCKVNPLQGYYLSHTHWALIIIIIIIMLCSNYVTMYSLLLLLLLPLLLLLLLII